MRCRTPSTGSFRHDEAAALLHKLTPHKRLALNMMNTKKNPFIYKGHAFTLLRMHPYQMEPWIHGPHIHTIWSIK